MSQILEEATALYPALESPLINAHHADVARPWSGLAEVIVEVQPNPGLGPVTLEVSFENNPTVFAKEIADPGISQVRLRLHTHLLPDGPVVMVLTAKQDKFIWDAGLSFQVNNSSSLGLAVRESLQRRGTPVVFDGPCDSQYYDYKDAAVVPWFDRTDALEYLKTLAVEENLTQQEVGRLKDFLERGFIVMEDFIDKDLLQQVGLELEDAIAKKVHGAEWGSSKRIEPLHTVYPGIRKLWKYEPIYRVLSLIFRSTPRACQTLTYFFGSQQDAHQDTVHLTPFPAGYMCGVWVAIDDVRPDSGELEVYVGSHRLPRVYMKDAGCPKVDGDWTQLGKLVVPRWREMANQHGFERILYRPKAGSVLIWHENLMHGGTVRKDPSLSRRSIVSHVFADGCICFYDSTGLLGHMDPVDPA
ncbi:MAG: hypothetical protein JWO19_5747 [Bryobacterales bacterium]|nr:hypothetical protein [Bryobacterales bacterium]